MPKIGLKSPVAALLDESGGVSTYKEGIYVGIAMSANITIENFSIKLYGNDALAESEEGFKSGSVALQTTDLTDEVQCYLLGHKTKETTIGETAIKEMVASGTDQAPFVGFGFYGRKKLDGALLYRAVFFNKVKFSEPNDENDTQGEDFAFKTPTINGTVYTDQNGEWKSETTVGTEADAIAWLKNKAAITDVPTQGGK